MGRSRVNTKIENTSKETVGKKLDMKAASAIKATEALACL